jgi:hypothetical protein
MNDFSWAQIYTLKTEMDIFRSNTVEPLRDTSARRKPLPSSKDTNGQSQTARLLILTPVIWTLSFKDSSCQFQGCS